ncbi:MAG: thiopeptide-type bacteriocin biosynthesis protein [Bacteroidota bacterium]
MKTHDIIRTDDHWLYVRIYTGYNTADKLLPEVLHPLVKELLAKKMADYWFFIRYADPDFHLRFRIKLNDASHSQAVMSQLKKQLNKYVENGLVWKVEAASYQPEKERYGELSMKYAEKLFCADSEAFMNYMHWYKMHGDEHSRWLFALLSANRILHDFKLSPIQRKDLLLKLNRGFGKEFNKNKHLARQISERYRTHRIRIRDLLEGENNSQADSGLHKIIQHRSKKYSGDVSAILELYKNRKIEVPLEEMLSSIIHMSMNRIFQNNNRLHEMVLYDLLFRHYKSALAREKKDMIIML